MPRKEKQNVFTEYHLHRRALVTFFILLAVSGLAIGGAFMFNHAYAGKIFPHTILGGIDVGNMSYEQATTLLESKAIALADQGLVFTYHGKVVMIPSTIVDATNPELSFPLYSYNVTATIQQLQQLNHRLSEVDHLYYLAAGLHVRPVVEMDEKKFTSYFHEQFGTDEQPAVDAQLSISAAGEPSIIPEKSGNGFNDADILNQVRQRLTTFSSESITLELSDQEPQITTTNATSALPLVRQVLQGAPYTLVYGDKAWGLSAEQLRSWLTFKLRSGQVTIGLQTEAATKYLQEIAQIINVPVKDAKFTMVGGKVTEFQPAQQGQELQVVDSLARIEQKIRQVGNKQIDLLVNETKPAVSNEEINNLGINELIGEGHSNFKGSPKNRRHNISVGASALNGVLIKPNEELSLVKTLGKIEASTGYLPELVIKGNKTTPEFGGGLCQIGTTTFRAALDAGLPITARTNHSYRVAYYEPAGTDATIYDPKPDFKFINDTGHYILFTTEMTDNDLYFRFYGTKDGRTVQQTKPRVFNQVKPGASKLVETTDLAPGVKKCTEKAHVGADTEFTRTIIYADGTKKVDTFKSHYKPWQEVCLIGVAKPVPPPAADQTPPEEAVP